MVKYELNELKEIEKVMDIYAGMQATHYADIIKKLGFEHREYAKKILDEAVKVHDMHRTISAKTALMIEQYKKT